MRRFLSALFWPACCVMLGGAWFVARTHETKLTSELAGRSRVAESYDEAIHAARRIEMHAVGRVVSWPRLEAIGERPTSTQSRRRLIAVFDEVSCNACEVTDTGFAKDIATATGSEAVIGVVQSSDRRYAAAFVRTHGIAFPVMWDPKGQFVKDNDLTPPVLLLLNEHDQVVSAGVPIPGRPAWSLPFRARAREYLGERRSVLAN